MMIIIISTTLVMVIVIGDKGRQEKYLRNNSLLYVRGCSVLLFKNPIGHC